MLTNLLIMCALFSVRVGTVDEAIRLPFTKKNSDGVLARIFTEPLRPLVSPKFARVPQQGGRMQGWESLCEMGGAPLGRLATQPHNHVAM